MNRSFRIAFLSIVAAGCGPTAWHEPSRHGRPLRIPQAVKEPEVEGRTLAQWMAVLEEGPDDARLDACSAIPKFGTDALPAVPVLRQRLADKDLFVRGLCAKALVDLDPSSKEAVGVLIDEGLNAKDPLIRDMLQSALRKMGQAAVPALSAALKDQSAARRRNAARMLGEIGPPAKDAIPALLPLLADSDAEVRAAACLALGEMGPQGREAISPLLRLVKEGKPADANNALNALKGIGPDARAGLPTLEGLVPKAHKALDAGHFSPADQPEPYLVASTLCAIDPGSRAGIQLLIRVLKNDGQRDAAARDLARLGRAAVPDLREALDDPDPILRERAAAVLREVEQ